MHNKLPKGKYSWLKRLGTIDKAVQTVHVFKFQHLCQNPANTIIKKKKKIEKKKVFLQENSKIVSHLKI